MATLGFVFLLLVGVYLLFSAASCVLLQLGFGFDHRASVAVTLFLLGGLLCLTAAYLNAPFTISWTSTP